MKFNSIAILIGVIGFIASLATLFLDMTVTLNIRYFLALIILFITTFIIQVKITYEVYIKKDSLIPITPIKCYPDKQMILCKEHPSLSLNSLISIYSYQDNIEQIIGVGYVSNVQTDKLIQVSITTLIDPDRIKLKEFLETTKIQNLILKTSVPFNLINK